MDNNTIRIDLTWSSTQHLEIPDGMSHDEAVQAFNNGQFDLFEDFDPYTAELTDWDAS